MPCILEAHRGVGTEYPENTLPAFRAAYAQHYGMCELDTKFTRDGACVILHDSTLNRMARNADGSELAEPVKIEDITLAEARAYDFGLSKGEQFRGTKICTLDEVLAFSAETGMKLKFDNVLQSHNGGQMKVFILTLLNSPALPNCGFTTASLCFAAYLHNIFPENAIHYDGVVDEAHLKSLSGIVPKELLTIWIRFDNDRTAWCKNPPVTEERAALIHRYGSMGVWLLDKPEELKRAEHFGAALAETDGSLKP